jgi:tetratricopeptide (TPR) repeat protein
MYKEARFEFERLLEKAHKYPIIEYYLGHCNLMLGNYAEAVIHLENATAVKKDYADYHYYYGRSLLESGHCRRAIQELMKAIKINPYYDKAYFFLALAYLKNAITKEDYTLAKDVFERTEGFMTKAAQIQPAYKTAEFDQGLRLLRDRELESACREFEAAFKEEVHTTTDFVLDFYIKYLQENDNLSLDYIRSYIQQLEDLIKKYPRYADLHFELGIAKVIMSKILLYRALRNFEEALSINAKFAKAEVKRNLLRNEQKGMKALLLTLLEP